MGYGAPLKGTVFGVFIRGEMRIGLFRAIGDMSGDRMFFSLTNGEKLRFLVFECFACLYASKEMSRESSASGENLSIFGEGCIFNAEIIVRILL